MHNIKDIRNNFDNFKNIIKLRNISIDLDQILDLDKNNRKLIQEKETLEQEKKEISKKKDKSLYAKSKEISEKILTINKKQSSNVICFDIWLVKFVLNKNFSIVDLVLFDNTQTIFLSEFWIIQLIKNVLIFHFSKFSNSYFLII